MECLDGLIDRVKKDYKGQFTEAEYKILMVSPELTGTNFYRLILPGMMLNTTPNYKVAYTSIEPHNPDKRFFQEAAEVGSREILWARTIVFPFTLHPMAEVFEKIRNINNDIRITYCIDFNFLCVPQSHPYSKYFTATEITKVLKNITAANNVVLINPHMGTPLVRIAEQQGITIDEKTLSCTNLCTHEDIIADVPDLITRPRDHFHLMVLCNDNQYQNFVDCVPLFRLLKEKHGNKLRLTIFSINNNRPGFSSLMKGIEYSIELPSTIRKYFMKLASKTPDAVFIPTSTGVFYQTSDDYKRFLDCGILGIPIITADLYPLNEIVKTGGGWIYQTPGELEMIIQNLIAHPEKVKEAGQEARMVVADKFSFTQNNLNNIVDSLI